MENNLKQLATYLQAKPLPEDIYPLSFKLIQKKQVREISLENYFEKNPGCSVKVLWGRKVSAVNLQRWKNIYSAFAVTSHSKLVSHDAMSSSCVSAPPHAPTSCPPTIKYCSTKQ